MSLKDKYDDWVTICEQIRPIWEDSKKEVHGNKDLWKIIHALANNPDLWTNFAEIAPFVQQQHPGIFKKKGPCLYEDLHEVTGRISRGQPITRPWQNQYNLPAFRAVMAIKDIIFGIKDAQKVVKFPSEVDTKDVFNTANEKIKEIDDQLKILIGLRQMYEVSTYNPNAIQEVIAHIDARIKELTNV